MKAQVSLCKCVDSSDPLLHKYMSMGKDEESDQN